MYTLETKAALVEKNIIFYYYNIADNDRRITMINIKDTKETEIMRK